MNEISNVPNNFIRNNEFNWKEKMLYIYLMGYKENEIEITHKKIANDLTMSKTTVINTQKNH